MKPDRTVEQVKQMLIAQGVRPSSQRVAILRYLCSVTSHPTAETVFDELSSKLDSLSRATVYNTLNLLASKNLIYALTIEGDEQRFDADISLHGHFKCSYCGELHDVLLSKEQQNSIIENLQGFQIDKAHLYLHGSCKRCTKRLNKTN